MGQASKYWLQRQSQILAGEEQRGRSIRPFAAYSRLKGRVARPSAVSLHEVQPRI